MAILIVAVFPSRLSRYMARAKAAAQVLNDLAGLKRGSLALAASQTVANYWLPPRVTAFRKAHPGIDLGVSIANTEQVADAVHRGDADLGFVEGEVDDPALAIRKIEGDSLAVVVGANHPWAGQTRITPKQLTKTCWILREPGSGTRSMFEAALKRFDIISISASNCHRTKPCALPSNPATVPPRSPIWSSRSRSPPERSIASRSTCRSARFTRCDTGSAMPAWRRRPC
jgi:DNA-binding transcriptional LysR family regulator